MKYLCRLSLQLVLLGALAVSSARSDTTNYWIATGGGDYTNTANWSGGAAPTTTDRPFFTNQAGPYTVTFSESVTNAPAFIYDDNVVFDLGGYRWQNNNGGQIGSNSAVGTTVRFSSSSSAAVTGGNEVQFGTSYAGNDLYILGTNTTVIADDSLGFPTRLIWYGAVFGYNGLKDATLVASGSGSELVIDLSPGLLTAGSVLVTNNAKFIVAGGWDFRFGHYDGPFTATVINASMETTALTPDGYVGSYSGSAAVILSNGSTWSASGDFYIGTQVAPSGQYHGSVFVESNSTLVGQAVTVGSAVWGSDGPGQLVVRNGSTATFSNWLFVSSISNSGVRSTLVLGDSTINLGGGGTAGVLTNLGIMRADGVINGAGSSPALVYVGTDGSFGSVLEIGSSIGTLTLSNANLQLAAGSETLFEFSDTGLDQIIINGGGASVLGSNLFSLAAGSAPLVPGIKWGLGAYDFIVGTNITWSPQYENLVALLTASGLVQNVDYRFGLVDPGTGQQFLRLEFVPEPSTVLLLIGGGGLFFRLGRRRRCQAQRNGVGPRV